MEEDILVLLDILTATTNEEERRKLRDKIMCQLVAERSRIHITQEILGEQRRKEQEERRKEQEERRKEQEERRKERIQSGLEHDKLVILQDKMKQKSISNYLWHVFTPTQYERLKQS